MSRQSSSYPPLALQSRTSVTNSTPFEHTIVFLRQHIDLAHTTGVWTWLHMHDPRWRMLFYDYLLREAALSAPLSVDEIRAYTTQLRNGLPLEGFFPPPHIATRSLALTLKYVNVHEPIPMQQQTEAPRLAPWRQNLDLAGDGDGR